MMVYHPKSTIIMIFDLQLLYYITRIKNPKNLKKRRI